MTLNSKVFTLNYVNYATYSLHFKYYQMHGHLPQMQHSHVS